MSSTLSEGVRVPDIGSTSWGADVNYNWGLLNTALANISGNVKTDAENTWTAPQTFTETISGSIDGVAARAVGDEDGNNIKTALAGKQPSLSQSQLDAVNSGVTAAAVQQIADNATAISGKQDALTVAQQAAVDSGATAAKIDQIAANASAIVSLTFSKQDSLSTTQLAAVNSGITASAVQQIGTNASNISSLQTAVSGKAADNSVVHLAGAETITGNKTWTGVNTFSEGVFAAGSKWPANTNTTGDITSLGQVFYCQQRASGTLTNLSNGAWNVIQLGSLGLFVRNNNYGDIRYKHFMSGTLGRIHTLDANGYEIIDLVPAGTNTYDLGTSSNKWKTLNGINPGALSLPGTGGYTDIKGDITNLSGGNNTFTAPYDGWVCIKSTNATAIHIINTTWAVGQSATQSTAGSLCCLCPVMSGQSFHVIVKATSLEYAYIHPCKGNV